ncbi:MAG: hypothetical protein KatS3mg003_1139 [Candidatus Nitrosocaldaceae archaeon]|nr:MAG: hypothetical protein KatS3mg003_1139 [Candidatus Nitrosocaldaceae archaeon]
MVERKKHRAEYILTIIAGILLIINSIAFVAAQFIEIPEDESITRMREELGEERFKLFETRVIISSIISGSMLIILAVAMEKNPRDLMHYGILAIIISIISIIGMGLIYPISIITTAIGITGGIIAIIRGKKGVIILEHTYREVYPDMEYLCTICNLRFNSDDELRKHMLKHIEER